MDKLNPNEFNSTLIDVRKAYRLLALYQQRILDLVKYIANYYGTSPSSGWPAFSRGSVNGNRANLDRISWDWLNMYCYKFHLEKFTFNETNFYLNILHQADTGYYDTKENKTITKAEVIEFNSAEASKSRIIFVLFKDKDQPLLDVLEKELLTDAKKITTGNSWISVSYDLVNFINEESTKQVLEDFNRICQEHFGISLTQPINLENQIV